MAASRRRPREESLARVVLVAGLLSAAALVWVATGVLEPPGPAGRAALSRLTGEAVDGVRAEWERFVGGGLAGKPVGSEIFEWPDPAEEGTAGAEPAPDVQPVEWFDRPRGALSAAAALLSEAGRLELRMGNLPEALAYAQDACTKSADAALTAEARLRVLQLASKLQRADLVREQWAAAHAELVGNELRQGLPYLLLSGLVASAALPEAERADALQPVVDAWVDGRLRFAGEPVQLVATGRWWSLEEDDALRLMRERLVRLVPAAAGRIAAVGERRGRAVVERALGGRPRGVESRWQLQSLGEAFFMSRGHPATQGFFTSREALLGAFLSALLDRSSLPEGCALDFGDLPDDAGPVVRAGEVLEDGVLVYDLRMADPDSVMSAESARVRTTRIALLVAAAFSAFAALASWRALHRQARLTRLKNRFIASVSHELRTPVASILLMAENLESGAVSGAGPSAKYHGLIRAEALRLRGLVNDVLDFSRLEHGEGTRVRCTLVRLPDFVQELGAELVERARAAGAGCSLECGVFPGPAGAAQALMDAEAVRRGMLNLLENALKHAGGEGVEVRLGVEGAAGAHAGDAAIGGEQTGGAAAHSAQARRASGPRGDLVFAVADRGPGIPASRRDAVLQPFERLDATGEGAGLGLAIVRAIAQAHDGELIVRDRRDGPGAVFELRLPWRVDGTPEGATA